MPSYKNNSFSLICFFALAVLSSCAPGYRAARSFVEKKEPVAVMIVPPTNTYLYYYPYYTVNDANDSLNGIKQSYFLHDLDVKRATALFTESLMRELKQYNLKVFTPDDFEQFLSYKGERYIFTTAQTEIVEIDKPYTERALIDTILYRQDFLLRTVERNTWFEFVKVDETNDNSGMKVLYSTFSTSDVIDGKFRYRGLTGEVLFEYTPYLLTPEDVYAVNIFAGKGNARYIYEFLLNQYAQKNTGKNLSPSTRFQFNFPDNRLYRSKNAPGFTIMEPEESLKE
jgi:hypothetical protein